MNNKKYIAIEGAIGVGKTTLAKKISDTVKCKTLFEDYITNPFLKDFYDHNQLNSFSTQVHFLLRRIEQSMEVKGTENLLISDFYFGKDELFAKLNLTQVEYAMYQELRKKLDFNPPIPDLIIYLQAPSGILLERIKKKRLRYREKYQKKIYRFS